MSNWQEPEFSISEESKDAWKILKHHTEVASDRIYEELPDIIQHAFEEGIAYAREQVAREIEAKCISAEHQGNHNGMGALTSDPSIVYYPETFSVCGRCSVAAAIARGEK